MLCNSNVSYLSLSVFACVCACVCPSMRQWARREAERVIQQRENEGVPLIEENYYDPNKIVLPSAGES